MVRPAGGRGAESLQPPMIRADTLPLTEFHTADVFTTSLY
jgi:hypothetical protein